MTPPYTPIYLCMIPYSRRWGFSADKLNTESWYMGGSLNNHHDGTHSRLLWRVH